MNGKFATTHQALIKEGMELFFKKGFDGVTISEICEHTGISRPTYYIHFKSKEQLISEYYESSFFFSEEMKDWIMAAPNKWSSIVRLQMIYIQFTCDPSQVDLIAHYLSFRLNERTYQDVPEVQNNISDLLLSLIRDAQKEKDINNMSDPHYLCSSTLMLHDGNLYHWCASNGQFDRYVSFFWNLEAVLNVRPEYRGTWKAEDSMMPFFS